MNQISLDKIKILVTSKCNLQCKHCYQHFEKNKFSLTKMQVFRLIDYAIEHDVRIIDFSGGEFFVYPHAYEIIDYCYEKDIDINIATNGVNVNVDTLAKYHRNNFMSIQVSMDGLQQNHEARRGIGTWDKVMRTVEALHNLGFKVTANMVLDQNNYMDALSVLQLPYFSEVFFTPIAYVGAAAEQNAMDNLEDYEEFACQLLKEFVCEEEEFSKQIFPVVVAIRYDGGVYISPIASDYELLCIGNINGEDISDICNRYYESDDFKKIKNLDVSTIQKCNQCEVKDICDRGNRFRSLNFFGNMMMPDPFLCRIYLDEYKDIPVGCLFWGINSEKQFGK